LYLFGGARNLFLNFLETCKDFQNSDHFSVNRKKSFLIDKLITSMGVGRGIKKPELIIILDL